MRTTAPHLISCAKPARPPCNPATHAVCLLLLLLLRPHGTNVSLVQTYEPQHTQSCHPPIPAAAPNNASYFYVTFCALSVAVGALIFNLISNINLFFGLEKAEAGQKEVGCRNGTEG